MPQSLSTCLCLCVNSHIPPFAASPQHTDRCEDRRERARERARESPDCGARPRCANIALLSPVCVCCSHSGSVCLPLGLTVFPLCQTQRASLLLRGGNATGAKSALLYSENLPPSSLWSHITQPVLKINLTLGNKEDGFCGIPGLVYSLR